MTTDQTYSPATRTALPTLPDLFRQIQNGEIRVPEFQRGFVWNRSQVRELFESIYAGYPIGSPLLWRTTRRSLKAKSEGLPFPTGKVSYPTYFIIDGVQRLSSVYGALGNSGEREPNSEFDVLFDLKEQSFLYSSRIHLDDWIVRVSSLFSYEEFVRTQALLLRSDDRKLRGNYIDLYNVLQEYALPVTIIDDRSPAEVAEIFIKINRQGQRLSQPDFDKAMDWIKE